MTDWRCQARVEEVQGRKPIWSLVLLVMLDWATTASSNKQGSLNIPLVSRWASVRTSVWLMQNTEHRKSGRGVKILGWGKMEIIYHYIRHFHTSHIIYSALKLSPVIFSKITPSGCNTEIFQFPPKWICQGFHHILVKLWLSPMASLVNLFES